MAGIFKTKEVPKSIVEELTARANVKGYKYWFATKTNWVHIRSFCNECTDDVKFLYTGANNNYSDGTSFTGLRPNPVIESVQVKAQGNLGTTRMCTVKIIAFTQEQIDSLVNCYGVPSMSVRVQFGWNKGATGALAPAPFGGILTDTQGVCKINTLREKYPMYDGLQGIVGKYSVNFIKESMWWEFALEIIAASSPVLGRPLEDFGSLCYCDRVSINPQNGESETESRGTSPFRAKIVNYIQEVRHLPKEGVYKIHLNAPERDELGSEAGGFMNMVSNNMPFNTPECDEAYITYGSLEQLINGYSFSQIEKKPLGASFDSEEFGLVSITRPCYSSDPHICLLPGLDFEFGENRFSIDHGYKGLKAVPSCVVPGKGINIKNVLINCIFVNKCIEENGSDGSLQDFFEKLLNGINSAVGNLFELSIVDDGNCDDGGGIMPTFSVIDLQKVDNRFAKPYILPVGPTSAVVRDIKLELKLPEAMKSQALYAGVRQSSTGNPGDNARFTEDIKKYKNYSLPATVTKPKGDCPPTTCKTEEEHKADKPSLISDYISLVDEITEGKKETVKSRLMQEHNKSAVEGFAKNMIVPYEFSFTVDGIGGFAFGQLVDCTLLPESVRKRYIYQIKAVEHSITYGDWTTTVETIARYK